MFHKLSSFWLAFLPHKLTRDLKHFYWMAFFSNLGQSMVLLFEPVYLYSVGYGISEILLYFLVVYTLYFLLIPLGSKFAEKYGYEWSMFIGSILWALYFVALIFINDYSGLFWVAIVLYSLQKSFYWPGYHAFFARYSDDSEEGKEVGTVYAMISMCYIFGPLLAGFLSQFFGFGWMFFVALLILLSANIPLLKNLHKFTSEDYGFINHWKVLFSSAFRRKFIAMFGYGEELIVLVLWPIFVSLYLPGQLAYGIFLTLSGIARAIITMVIGKKTDSIDREKLYSNGVISYLGSWISRLFAVNPLQIFVMDIWSTVSKDMIQVPLFAMIYNQAHSGVSKISRMQTIVLHESGLIMGKILACLLGILLINLLPEEYVWQIVFSLGAIFSLLFLIYRKKNV